MTPAGAVTTLHSFDLSDGRFPGGKLVEKPGEGLFGTTAGGKQDGGGSRSSTLDGTFSLLRSYSYYDGIGELPTELSLGPDGGFYGATAPGPAECGGGVLYRLSSAGQATLLHDTCTDPRKRRVDRSNRRPSRRRETVSGSAFRLSTTPEISERSDNSPTIWASGRRPVSRRAPTAASTARCTRASPAARSIASIPTVARRCCTCSRRGMAPPDEVALWRGSDGRIYGTYASSDPDDHGAVFRFDVRGEFEIVHDFNGDDGSDPNGVIQGAGTRSTERPSSAVRGDRHRVSHRSRHGRDVRNPRLGLALQLGPDDSRGQCLRGRRVRHDRRRTRHGRGRDEPDDAHGDRPAADPGSPLRRDRDKSHSSTGKLVNGWFADFMDVSDWIRSRLRREGRAQPRPRRLRQRPVWPGRPGDARTDGGVHPEGRARARAPAEAVRVSARDLRGRGLRDAFRGVDRRLLPTRYHRRLRHGPAHVLSRRSRDTGADGGFRPEGRARQQLRAPACTGVFDDVPCPSTFADWIEDLYNAGATAGCSVSPALFCPNMPVSRGQMAVLIVRAFGLP